MDSKVYSAILKTVCYADIFDYPLTKEELYQWVIQEKNRPAVKKIHIQKANGFIFHKDSLVYLKGREELLKKRVQRQHIADKKIAIAKRIGRILHAIPTVKLIGISGSVAMENAKVSDDIDLFIIADKGMLWFTRLTAILIVELFANRRHPADCDVADKICLNMFMDEGFLELPKGKQNLYTAHEVCQLKVLYDKEATYKKFMQANEWVKEYLPNRVSSMQYTVSSINKKEKRHRRYLLLTTLYFILEFFAKHLQLWYMGKRKGKEVVTDTYLAFHPKDYTQDILSVFRKKLVLYGAEV